MPNFLGMNISLVNSLFANKYVPDNKKPNNTKGEFKTWMGKDGIMRIIVTGVLDEESAKEFVKEMLKIFNTALKKVDGIAFIGKARKSPAAARKIMIDGLKHEKIGKIAVVGAPSLIRVMADVMLKIAGMKNTKHFKTEAEAVKWIKEK